MKAELIEKRKKIEDEFEELIIEGRVVFITFHPSYSYEEFIEGITVETSKDSECSEGKISYKLKSGIFKKMCSRALDNVLTNNGIITNINTDLEENCWNKLYRKYLENKESIDWEKADTFVMAIDEINRGEISRIFGELITLIETDKRIGSENQIIVTLPYSNDKFGVPRNIIVIGTMNTADRSLSLLDIALRRRFDFMEMPPKEHLVIESYEGVENTTMLYRSVMALKKINEELLKLEYLGKDKRMGHSFFFKGKEMEDEDVYNVWIDEVFPLLEEYFYERFDLLQQTLNLDNTIVDRFKGFNKERITVDKLLDTLAPIQKVV